jgi:hypothetical protein
VTLANSGQENPTFEVGDRVKISATPFQETVGIVVRIIPGRTRTIPWEFMVRIAGRVHLFFEEQLVREL